MKRYKTIIYLCLIIIITSISLEAFADQAEKLDLFIGRDMVDVGDVFVWNDDINIYIKYVTDENWCLTATHLQPVEGLRVIVATKKGNPVPGQFLYKKDHSCVNEYTYTVPMSSYQQDHRPLLFIAAHADVKEIGGSKEGAWAGDREIPGKNWALYFNYDLR